MNTPFTLFGTSHLLIILFLIIGVTKIYFTRNWNHTYNQIVRIAIISTLIFQAILFNGWHIYHGTYLIGSYLPFHLCSISLYLVVISLITKNPKITALTYYIAFISALLAVVSPDVRPDQNFPSFRFIEFFLSHTFIVLGVAYMIVVDKIKISYRSLWVSFGILFIYMLVVFPINKITGGNYLFLNQKPGTGGLFTLFPPEPYHILALIPATILIFHIEYLLYKLFTKIQ
ncbi:MAG: TIGR02206 family membrane protein [candidate division SR1 bacterium]|nr:TIGR02206 family membrane protein [candidate division SR1 bacterium]